MHVILFQDPEVKCCGSTVNLGHVQYGLYVEPYSLAERKINSFPVATWLLNILKW